MKRLRERNNDLKADLLGAGTQLSQQSDDAKVQLAKAEADRHRLRESLRAEQFILWGEIALTEAKAQAQRGRRLKSRLHDDPKVSAAWDAFRDALDASIEADVKAAGEAL
ncbi:hypothetical protein GCM10029992_12320 [Glycomyces albus]